MSEELNIDEKLKEIDESNEQLQKSIDLYKDMQELVKDERFIRVVKEGYLDAYATELFTQLVSPKINEMNENIIMNDLMVIKGFNRYFGDVTQPGALANKANFAKNEIKANEAFKLELMSGVDNG